MKKTTSLTIALTMLLSLAACSSEDGSMAETVFTPTAAETQTIKDETVTETEAEETTVREETTTEETTTEAEPEPEESEPEESEVMRVVNDMILERGKDNVNTMRYIDDNIIVWINGFYVCHYNIKTEEFKILSNEDYYLGGPDLCVKDDKICIRYTYGIYVYDLSGELISYVSVEDIDNMAGRSYSYSDEIEYMYLLDDGSIIIHIRSLDYDGRPDNFDGILSTNLSSFTEIEFPVYSIDLGHGVMYDCRFGGIRNICGNKAYIYYYDDHNRDVNMILDIETWELSEPEEADNEFYDEYQGPFVGKYYLHWYYCNQVFNTETRELTYINKKSFNNAFITDKAFYYVKDKKLYKFISEEESELIYEGSYISCVSEDYLLVHDDLGIFFVNRQTGEEKKIEIE